MRRFPSGRLALCLLPAVWLTLAAPASAQILPADGMQALERENQQAGPLINSLVKGELPFDAKNEDHLKAIDVDAKMATYRLTWKILQEKAGEMDKIHFFFFGRVNTLAKNRPTTLPLARAYYKQVMVRAREVLANKAAIARVNVARYLPMIAGEIANLDADGQKEVSAALLDLLLETYANTKDEGVKYYVLRGFGSLFKAMKPLATQMEPITLDAGKEEKAVAALVELIEKKALFPKNHPAEEVEAFRVLRREAIRALGQTRFVRVSDKVIPALTLLRVVADDGLDPVARPDERVEAVAGLCRLRPRPEDKDYQPEYAAYVIGQFLVDATVRYANRKTTNDETRPWKIWAAKIADGMDLVITDTKNPYLTTMYNQVKTAVADMEKDKLDITPPDLTQWLQDNKPPGDALFKSVEKSKVTYRPWK